VIDSKKVFWTLGTILLGALGSGLWDLAIKPSAIFLVEFIIDVVLGAFSGVVIFLCIAVFRKPKEKNQAKKELPKFLILLYGLFIITFTFLQ
jgi:hypothetical protein